MSEPTVAIAHDYLTQRGGAERVVLAMHRAFPEAPIYTTLYAPDRTFPEFRDANIVMTGLNRMAPLRREHRFALPLLAATVGRTHIPADVVIASTSGWAHGFRTDGRMLVYCHSPARWLYLTDQYVGRASWRSPRGLAALAVRTPLIRWDRAAAARADHYWANSRVVQTRIHDVYGIDAELLHPPYGIDVTGPMARPPQVPPEPFHLLVARLLPYKNVDQVLAAYVGRSERLLVVGDGPMRDQLRRAAPPNVAFAPQLDDAHLRWCYAHASALLAASYEDFGLTILEAAAFGTPAVALRAGGFLDSVREDVTGVFFDEPTSMAISRALDRLSEQEFDPEVIAGHAATFGEARFAERLRQSVASFATG
ncbi:MULTISPECIES: glycosyltransferase [unclassified Allobranchiibius]|uniref:glycosyltransferase n=1 Tax=unclassified Allobranchiibius TaxID=2649857 RepID=UPI001AA13176|nr:MULTISPECIES: glycosyltransferase [unclassified Allobranchiibius]MBO1765221.1 glycosyltransferase [Allobranchiibius sp. GilTou38]UIJ33484.1 glycosyltransferase [Allobranchiibius sp. GilTou73]